MSDGYRSPPSPRRPSTDRREERRGFLDRLVAPRSSSVAAAMPPLRASITRGIAATWSTPWIAIGVPIVVALVWLGLVAAGFQGPFALLVNALALPPVATLTDVSLAGDRAGGGLVGLGALAGVIVLRGILLALVTSAAVTSLRGERVTRWFAVLALRALPATLAVSVLSLSLLLAQSILGSVLGGAGGLGLLVFFGGLVLGVSWLSFAPAIALAERRRLGAVLQRSVRVARSPGSGTLTAAVLYVVPSYAMLVAPGKPGGLIVVNASPGAWALVVVVNLLHVAFTAAQAYRYLAVAASVPEPTPPKPSGGRSGGARDRRRSRR